MNEEQLEAKIQTLRARLVRHPIYGAVKDVRALRTFMTSHVFAVWDFMTLVKTLQRTLTCVDTPWRPPANPVAARLVNCIVLGEESDEIAPGTYTSHFELYLRAMDEIGADRSSIDKLVESVGDGWPVDAALRTVALPSPTADFVRTTMRIARDGAVHEVAAAFLYGREDLVPDMFRRISRTLDVEGCSSPRAFRVYLDRHVDMDERDHSPMAHDLLRSLCARDSAKWTQAAAAAGVAMEARLRLWDGVLEEIQRRPHSVRPQRATGSEAETGTDMP